jgi:large subunit ribosomal protein L17
MRHNASGRKLGRKTGHRLAMFRNQLASLVAQERIVTTVSKAKELRPLAERIVTQGKRGTVHARRLVGRWVANRELIKKLFDEIAPRFASRAGGYLRIVKLGSRQGDGAEMAILEFVDFKLKAKAAVPAADDAKGKKRSKSSESAGEGEPAAAKKSKAAKPKPAVKAKPAAKSKEAKTRATTKSPAAKKTSASKKIGGS